MKCGFEIEKGMKFCPKCGGEVSEVVDDSKCVKCGKDFKGVNAKFCSFCGATISKRVEMEMRTIELLCPQMNA